MFTSLYLKLHHLCVVVLFVTFLILNGPSAAYAQKTLSIREAVLRSFALIGGRGYMRDDFEVAISVQKNAVTVLFRKPLSHIIVTPGRFLTKDLLKVTWRGEKPTVTVLDKPQDQDAFDSNYTKSRDEIRAKVVLAALTDLWNRQKVKVDKEFEVSIRWNLGCYAIGLTHIPRVPDDTGFIYVSPEFKVVERK